MTRKTKLKGFSPVRRFKNDEQAINAGVWRDYADGAAKLLIARFNNPAHTEYLRAEREKHAKLLNDETKAESQELKDLLTEMGNRAMAKHILKGWEGILDEDGETELPYSEDNAYKLLSELEEFSGEVFQLSLEAEHYRAYKEGEAAKN